MLPSESVATQTAAGGTAAEGHEIASIAVESQHTAVVEHDWPNWVPEVMVA
jgi:hypothetical protein